MDGWLTLPGCVSVSWLFAGASTAGCGSASARPPVSTTSRRPRAPQERTKAAAWRSAAGTKAPSRGGRGPTPPGTGENISTERAIGLCAAADGSRPCDSSPLSQRTQCESFSVGSRQAPPSGLHRSLSSFSHPPTPLTDPPPSSPSPSMLLYLVYFYGDAREGRAFVRRARPTAALRERQVKRSEFSKGGQLTLLCRRSNIQARLQPTIVLLVRRRSVLTNSHRKLFSLDRKGGPMGPVLR